MSFYRFQCRIPVDTGAGKDIATNTWHFISDDADTEINEVTDIVAALTGFYQAIDALLSENVATPLVYRGYDMEDPPDRVPIVEGNIALTPGLTWEPNQVAVVANLRTELFSGQPRGRTRGRHYLGPMASTATGDGTGDVGPQSTTRDTIGNAYGALIPTMATPVSTSTIRLCVFSKSDALGLPVGGSPPASEPTYTSAQLSAGFKPVTSVTIGDRYGVVRSRRTDYTIVSTYT